MAQDQYANNADQTRCAGELLVLNIVGCEVNFRWAPPGTFVMGSPEDEPGRWKNETQHEVTLTKGFWIAETPTTQEFWHVVMWNNPSWIRGSSQLPVNHVSWYGCQNFIDALNTSFASALPSGYKYALPTEAQWEYACRAGTTTPFSFGSTLNGDEANCDGNYPYGTSLKGPCIDSLTPVGSYAPNNWGVYDMHGNVLEWCADWYNWNYYTSEEARRDPCGPSSGTYRILRGGSWGDSAQYCRSARRYTAFPDYACRSIFEPGYQDEFYGFRLVLVPFPSTCD